MAQAAVAERRLAQTIPWRHRQSDEAWDAFRLDYFAELDAGGEEVRAALFVLDSAAAAGPVTLLYAAKSAERNNALALREWLARR